MCNSMTFALWHTQISLSGILRHFRPPSRHLLLNTHDTNMEFLQLNGPLLDIFVFFSKTKIFHSHPWYAQKSKNKTAVCACALCCWSNAWFPSFLYPASDLSCPFLCYTYLASVKQTHHLSCPFRCYTYLASVKQTHHLSCPFLCYTYLASVKQTHHLSCPFLCYTYLASVKQTHHLSCPFLCYTYLASVKQTHHLSCPFLCYTYLASVKQTHHLSCPFLCYTYLASVKQTHHQSPFLHPQPQSTPWSCPLLSVTTLHPPSV